MQQPAHTTLLLAKLMLTPIKQTVGTLKAHVLPCCDSKGWIVFFKVFSGTTNPFVFVYHPVPVIDTAGQPAETQTKKNLNLSPQKQTDKNM